MATDTELELPNPLRDDEIVNAIAHKVAEAVFDKLKQYGPLYGKSFPKFQCAGSLRLRLDNFGLITESNHVINVGDFAEGQNFSAEDVVVEIDIPETPPNLLRRETEQPVPTMVNERGRQVEKAVFYQPKRGRPAKVRE